jgi:hypothetical protein
LRRWFAIRAGDAVAAHTTLAPAVDSARNSEGKEAGQDNGVP